MEEVLDLAGDGAGHGRQVIVISSMLANTNKTLAEVVGYIARYSSAKHVTERNPYVIQFTLIILAPVLMAGVIYVVFARMVFWVVPPEQRSLKLLWVSRESQKCAVTKLRPSSNT